MAAVKIHKCERLKELGFRLLIPVHDEFIGECPEENAKECKELFAQCMCDAAIDLGIPISCDVSVTRRWYGEEIMVWQYTIYLPKQHEVKNPLIQKVLFWICLYLY